MEPTVSVVLVVVALVAGVGITTVGPGGVFVTAALFGLTDLSSAAVAGTASATFVATGLVGSGAYLRSGELGTGAAREAAAILTVTGVAGALLGTRANLAVSDRAFGYSSRPSSPASASSSPTANSSASTPGTASPSGDGAPCLPSWGV